MKFKLIITLIVSAFLVACSDKVDNSDIPSDPSNVDVPETVYDNVQPSATFKKTSGNSERIVVNLLGIIDPNNGEPIEINADYDGDDANFYLEEDGVLQGVKITEVSTSNKLKADVVFTVDNSGSMGQEADSIAFGIIKFAQFLADEGLDVQFGCIGYDSYPNGGINFTDEEELEDFLRREYYGYERTGTNRTYGFYGADSQRLADEAYTYNWYSHSGENGVVAVLFADSLFGWRSDAQRVFVNFTDEPTQSSTYYTPQFNTEYMRSKIYGKASVHTVFSEDTTYYSNYWSDYYERPWAMSECTGGTQIFLPYDAEGLDLTTLPVAGALANSYKIEFVTSSPNGVHTVVITIKENGADGSITYEAIEY